MSVYNCFGPRTARKDAGKAKMALNARLAGMFSKFRVENPLRPPRAPRLIRLRALRLLRAVSGVVAVASVR